tara:strand:+ start:1956 stop:2684 length:729 start_codon:yes stop_codon:yes gene_type:complete
MEPIKELKGKTVAIVGMGASWFDYNLAKSHGSDFDEVWAINAVGTVIFHDRVFMMDPPSRFLDSDDAGGQTQGMRDLLIDHNKPIYTCELDKRCNNLHLYPIDEILRDMECSYLNNTVAYAIAFALWNEVAVLKLFGIDFSYQGNLHFAEAGRGCVEFWLSKGMMTGMTVEVANSSALLDTAVPLDEKLYGYHRLDDPLVPVVENGVITTKKVSEGEKKEITPKPTLIGRNAKIKIGEPNKW